MKLNCITLDDSALHLLTISKLINENQNLQLLGGFSSPTEAKYCISTNKIDLIFLDIEMPIINGFDFLDGLKVKPQIIFISIKENYAMKAFDYNATDYICKPVNKARFNLAVDKALALIGIHNIDDDDDDEFIFIKSNLKKIKIYLSKIKWIESFGDYVKVITLHESHLVLSTMKSFESNLPANKFIRVHKSYIINLTKVENFNSKFAEIDSFNIPISRNKKENLFKAIANITQ